MLFTQKLPLIPSLIPYFKSTDSDWFAYIMYFIIPYATAVQFFGHTFLAFNRFTLFWTPLKYEGLWKRQRYNLFLLLLTVIAGVWILFIFRASFGVTTDNKLFIMSRDSEIEIVNNLINTVLSISTTFLTAIFNVFAFIKIYSKKQAGSAQNSMERRLLCKLLFC